ncbi:hypothetical protein LWI29_025854 [Acer saccharum]|uniref:Uncharacterized protein n=1 Tax=Acer saccharum TaxID=4024 RepID=A0AA39VGQ1_ACESA|nr:hypothetical protein LWI29_025854 [Acer saccharum]
MHKASTHEFQLFSSLDLTRTLFIFRFKSKNGRSSVEGFGFSVKNLNLVCAVDILQQVLKWRTLLWN